MSILLAALVASLSASPSTTGVVNKSFSCKLTGAIQLADEDSDPKNITKFSKEQYLSFTFDISFLERNKKTMVEFQIDKNYDLFKLNGIYYTSLDNSKNLWVDRSRRDRLFISTKWSELYVYYQSINDYTYFPKPFENLANLSATCEPKQ